MNTTQQQERPIPLFERDEAGESWLAQNRTWFRSEQALRWFFRRHKAELIERGAMLLHANRWFVRPSRFTAALIEIGERDAAAAAAPGRSRVAA